MMLTLYSPVDHFKVLFWLTPDDFIQHMRMSGLQRTTVSLTLYSILLISTRSCLGRVLMVVPPVITTVHGTTSHGHRHLQRETPPGENTTIALRSIPQIVYCAQIIKCVMILSPLPTPEYM